MSGIVSRITLTVAVAWLLCGNGPADGGGAEAAERVVRGEYKRYLKGKEVGQESFTRRILDNNTIVFESTIKVSFYNTGIMSETTYAVLDEDSYFPRSYRVVKEIPRTRQEVSVEMFANVAVIESKRNEQVERRTVTLSTGAVIFEGERTHQLSILLHRYNSSLGGKQRIIVFDPLSKGESQVILEHIGPDTTTLGGEVRELDHYRVRWENQEEVDFYVDESDNVIKAVNKSSGIEFVLQGLKEEDG